MVCAEYQKRPGGPGSAKERRGSSGRHRVTIKLPSWLVRRLPEWAQDRVLLTTRPYSLPQRTVRLRLREVDPSASKARAPKASISTCMAERNPSMGLSRKNSTTKRSPA